MPILLPPPPLCEPPVGFYRLIDRDESLTSEAYLQPLREQIYRSRFWRTKARFEEARERLRSMAYLAQGWDTYGSEPPNPAARELAARILDVLETVSLAPTTLTPTAEGGVALSFVEGNARAVIEAYNTGEVAAATYANMGEPTVWELESADAPLRGSIEQIRVHLAA